jgi:Toprim-like
MNLNLSHLKMTKQKIYDDGSFYKKNVDLVQFAADAYGYEIDVKKTGRLQQADNHRWVFMRKKNNPDDCIIVSKINQKEYGKPEDDHYYHMSLNKSGDHSSGSVFDFVQNRENTEKVNFNFGHVRKKLDQYIRSKPIGSNITLVPYSSTKEIDVLAIEKLKDIKPFTETTFLNERGIDKDIIEHPKFKDQIYNSLHHYKQETTYDTTIEKTHINTAFPIINEKGLIGFDVRNTIHDYNGVKKGFKGTIAAKYGGLSRSNVEPDKPITSIRVYESPIDAISYFKINKEQQEKDNDLLLSTCGQPSASQVELIQKYANGTLTNGRKPANLVLSFDNSKSGNRFAIKTIGNLTAPDFVKDADKHPKYLQNAWFDVSDDKINSQLNFKINTKNKEDIELVKNLLTNEFKNVSKDLDKNVNENKSFELSFVENKDMSIKGNVKFKSLNENFNAVYNVISNVKFNKSLNIKKELSVLSDFNDDLKAKLGLDKTLEKRYNNKLSQNNVLTEKNPVKKEFTKEDILKMKEYVASRMKNKTKIRI